MAYFFVTHPLMDDVLHVSMSSVSVHMSRMMHLPALFSEIPLDNSLMNLAVSHYYFVNMASVFDNSFMDMTSMLYNFLRMLPDVFKMLPNVFVMLEMLPDMLEMFPDVFVRLDMLPDMLVGFAMFVCL